MRRVRADAGRGDVVRPAAGDVSPLFKVTTPDGERTLDAYTDEGFEVLSQLWTRSGWQRKLSYEVTWLGVPIIQLPEDMVMMQELLWKVRPDVVVECGVAHGGSLLLYASILELAGNGRVVGVDVEIRKYNRLAIESHPLSGRIELIEGDSVAAATIERVRAEVGEADRVLVALDSRHSRDHVAAELEAYAPLVSPGSYLVVFDGVMPMVSDAPLGSPEWAEDNPLAAVRDFLASQEEFEVDPSYERLRATYCHGGFLRRAPAP